MSCIIFQNGDVMLMEVFEHHNQQMKALIGREFSHHTFERYTTSKHTQQFMNWKYKVDDMDIRKLNYEFRTNYEFWRKTRAVNLIFGCRRFPLYWNKRNDPALMPWLRLQFNPFS
jgi:hypothetical protein